MILAAGLSPAWQQIALLDELSVGEVNRAREMHACASGKVLNVGLALRQLGAESKTLSVLGGLHGEAIEREFAALGVPRRWVLTETNTRVCTTILDRSRGATTELVENAGPITAAELRAFEQAFVEEAAKATIVVLTGSLPAGVPPTFYRDLLRQTPQATILDMRGPELLAALERGAYLVKPNREELGQTFGRSLTSDDDVLTAIDELHRRGAWWVLITQGTGPVWLSDKTGQQLRLVPPAVETVNPIGCGDCLTAGIAYGMAAGWDMPLAVSYGMAAAADNARQLLPARLDPQRVAALVEQVEFMEEE